VETTIEQPQEGTGVDKLPADLRRDIDAKSVIELLNEVATIKKTLSRKGQVLLRYEAQLERIKEQADAILTVLEKDPRITGMNTVLDTAAVKEELRGFLTLPEPELKTALQEFMAHYGVTAAELRQLREYKDAKSSQERVQKLLDRVKSQLTAPEIPEIPVVGGTGGRSLGKILDELEKQIGGTADDGDSPVGEPSQPEGDIMELLKALAS